SAKAQALPAGFVPWPVAVIDSAVPFSCPAALPEIARPLAHSPVKPPEIDVPTWDVIWYRKPAHVFGLEPGGSAGETHVPMSGDVGGGGVVAGGGVAAGEGESRFVLLLSNPQAAVSTTTQAIAPRAER